MNIVKNLIYFAPAGDGGTAVTIADNILNKIGTLGLIVIAGAVIIGLIVFAWGYTRGEQKISIWKALGMLAVILLIAGFIMMAMNWRNFLDFAQQFTQRGFDVFQNVSNEFIN